MYELISGRRPLKEHKTLADIRRAVQNGIRPSLYNVHVMSMMPFIELLMQVKTVTEFPEILSYDFFMCCSRSVS